MKLAIIAKISGKESMRLFSYLFFIVMLCIPSIANSNSCSAGYYSYLYTQCYDCPPGCYCPGVTDAPWNGAVYSRVAGWCSNRTVDDSDVKLGLRLCPSDYKNSYKNTTSINNCYLTTSAGKYVASAGGGQVSCTAGYKCPGSVTVKYNSTGGREICKNVTVSNTSRQTYSGSGASSCSNCPAPQTGWFADTTQGLTKVTDCVAFANAGTSSISNIANCSSGKFKKNAKDSTSWNQVFAIVTAFKAKAGYKVTGSGSNTKCEACGKGYYSTGGATSCTACPTLDGWSVTTSGTTSTGVTACEATQTPANCVSGKIKKKAKSTTTWDNATVSETLKADKGYVARNTECKACPSASGWDVTTESTGSTQWSQCRATKSVQNCDGYLLKKATSASAWGSISSDDLAAKAGYYKTGSGANAKCELCPAGTISAGGINVTSCTKCDAGKATNAEHTKCVSCDVGQYVGKDGFCKDCPNKSSPQSLVYNDLYTFTHSEYVAPYDVSTCAIKLTQTTCDKNKTSVIYVYDEVRETYVRKADYKVFGNDRSAARTGSDEPDEIDVNKDYCANCADDGKYRIKNADGEWVCGFCNAGYCIKNDKCEVCPEGYACEEKEDANLQCSSLQPCGRDQFSSKGATQCGKCAVAYSTYGSGPASSSNNDVNSVCLSRDSKGYGIGCKSSSACKEIRTQLCVSPNCSCAANRTANTDPEASFVEKRASCRSSFPLADHVQFGEINSSVIQVILNKSTSN